MRNQIKLTFQIGYQTGHEAFELDIIKAASAACGGCTTSAKQGWWMTDGAEHRDTFTGTLESERCFELELTCEERKAPKVYHFMQGAIAQAATKHSVDTDWVHVTDTAMIGRHFSVKAMQDQLASIAAE